MDVPALLPPHPSAAGPGPLWPLRPRDALLLLLRHARRRGPALRRGRAQQAGLDLPQGVPRLGRARAGGRRADGQDGDERAGVVPGLRHGVVGDGAEGRVRAALRRAGEAAEPGEGAERDRRRCGRWGLGRRRGGAAAGSSAAAACWAAAATSAAAEALKEEEFFPRSVLLVVTIKQNSTHTLAAFSFSFFKIRFVFYLVRKDSKSGGGEKREKVKRKEKRREREKKLFPPSHTKNETHHNAALGSDQRAPGRRGCFCPRRGRHRGRAAARPRLQLR